MYQAKRGPTGKMRAETVGKLGVTCMCALNGWQHESSNDYGNRWDCRNASPQNEKKRALMWCR